MINCFVLTCLSWLGPITLCIALSGFSALDVMVYA